MRLNIEEMIEVLEVEKDRVMKVIAVLKTRERREARGRRRLSAAAKKRISDGMKRNWAARKEAKG